MRHTTKAKLAFFLCLAFGLLLALSGTSYAAEPTSTAETYGTWTVKCNKLPQQKVCEMAQVVTVKGRQGVVAQIAIGQLPGSADQKVVMQVPVGVLLRKGVKLTADDKPVIETDFLVCNRQSCLADTTLKPAQVSAMTAAKKMQLVFEVAEGKPVQLPISPQGMKDAYTATFKK